MAEEHADHDDCGGLTIESPPCPAPWAASVDVYEALAALVTWARAERRRVARCLPPAEAGKVAAVDSAGSIAAWSQVALQTQYGAAVALVKLRAQWDSAVRAFETRWNGPDALRARTSVISGAATILHYAFLAPDRAVQKASEAAAKLTPENVAKVITSALKEAGFGDANIEPIVSFGGSPFDANDANDEWNEGDEGDEDEGDEDTGDDAEKHAG